MAQLFLGFGPHSSHTISLRQGTDEVSPKILAYCLEEIFRHMHRGQKPKKEKASFALLWRMGSGVWVWRLWGGGVGVGGGNNGSYNAKFQE